MAIQTKQKSKRDRTSPARHATSDELERTAVTPAVSPEGAARSQQQPAPEESGASGAALDSDPFYLLKRTSMFKLGNETRVALFGELEDLMRDLGTKERDFFAGLVDQAGNASPKSDRYHEEFLEAFHSSARQFVDGVGVKSMFAFIKEGKPRDTIETSLLAQMAATHAAAMRFANLLANAKSLAERDSAGAYVQQVDANIFEANGRPAAVPDKKQKIVYQYLSVSGDGQAIVGDVSQPARKRTLRKRTRLTPMIPDGRQAQMDVISEPRRARVPLRRK